MVTNALFSLHECVGILGTVDPFSRQRVSHNRGLRHLRVELRRLSLGFISPTELEPSLGKS